MSRFARWQVLLAAGGGISLIVGWQRLPALESTPLLALGGCLVGLALAPQFWRIAFPQGLRSPDRLAAVAAAFQEGMADFYSLAELGRTVSPSPDPDQLFTTTMKRVAETTGVESYALFVHDDVADRLVLRASRGGDSLPHRALAPGEGMVGRVYRSGTPETYSRLGPLTRPDVPPGARSIVTLPVTTGERTLGVLMLYSPTPGTFTERETTYFTEVGRHLGIALENAQLFLKTKELSYRDGLTGLFNRRYLEEALERETHRATRYHLPVSLLMADIDYFKIYNDTHGHQQGDVVLKEVAARLIENTRQVDIVARYGGEEIVLILPMTTKSHAHMVAEKLRHAVEEMKIPGAEVLPGGRITISLGLASHPEDASDPAALLQAADAALYAAKRMGRNRTVMFGPT